MIDNPKGVPISIIAPWGEEQVGNVNCKLLAGVLDDGTPNTEDKYIIGGQEFADTYELVPVTAELPPVNLV